jgi:hypothetical protein
MIRRKTYRDNRRNIRRDHTREIHRDLYCYEAGKN